MELSGNLPDDADTDYRNVWPDESVARKSSATKTTSLLASPISMTRLFFLQRVMFAAQPQDTRGYRSSEFG
jgi:hypothetical protein